MRWLHVIALACSGITCVLVLIGTLVVLTRLQQNQHHEHNDGESEREDESGKS